MISTLVADLGGPLASASRDDWAWLADEVLARSGTVAPPVLPKIATQVLELTRRAQLDLNELVGLVQRDAAIATTILRAANSPAHAPAVPITTLRGAIHSLGTERVVEVVLGASGRAFYQVASREELALFPALWPTMFDEAMANAFSAGRLALDLRGARSEHALLAGLLSDLGRPLALRIVSQILLASGTTPPEDPIVLAVLDEVAPLLGDAAVRAMELPDELRSPESIDHTIARLVAAIGAVQRRSARMWANASDVRRAAEALGLHAYAVRAAFTQRQQHVRDAAALFGNLT